MRAPGSAPGRWSSRWGPRLRAPMNCSSPKSRSLAERQRTAPAQSTVHLLCGLPGAGKTTVARKLGAGLPAVRFSLDEWMLRLYPEVHFASGEYGDLAETCKLLIWDTALQVLQAGTDVVLDWNQWSRERRAVWAAKAVSAGAAV